MKHVKLLVYVVDGHSPLDNKNKKKIFRVHNSRYLTLASIIVVYFSMGSSN